ncbi:carbon-nitrogen hydrolase family protein [Cohnella sp.]|uniref:carbon-nitrogen hydrolase family protein n=1 Tax=Cohnella sp. TaxID=1883426 RepID=UPI003568EE36
MKKITIATTQYGLTDILTEEQFWTGLSVKIQDAAENGAALIVFPEYLTTHLLSIVPTMMHDEACHHLDLYTAKYLRFFELQSKEWNIAILGGSHICREAGEFVNKAFLFFPDGRMETQSKLHLTPEEHIRWPLTAGEELNVFDTEWGRAAILTCYDIEFPELARAAAVRGAELILCPSYTDTSYGYHRVRHCCQARAIENQVFVVMSGLVGTLTEDRPQVDQGYCQAGVFTPCDVPFFEDGIMQVGELNRNMTIFAEVDFRMLRENRQRGAVAPFYDRRPALYEEEFRKTSK